MKKYIQNLVIAGLILVISPSIGVFGADTPVKPVGSDYTNNSANKSFNDNGRSNADTLLTKDSAGNYTESSIRSYQESKGLKVDGKLGADTAAALNNTTIKTLNAVPGAEIQKVDGAPLASTALDCKLTPTLPECNTANLLGVEAGKLRKGDVNMQTIVEVILNIIGFLLGIAGTVAIFSLIYHAVKMQLSSGITGDSSGVESAKKGMIGAVIGFVIAISAWFLVTRIVQLLVEVS